MAKTIDELVEQVENVNTVADSLITITNDLKQKLDDALSGVSIPPAVQAKIDSAFDSLEAQRQQLADAVLANTPSDPETPVEPNPNA